MHQKSMLAGVARGSPLLPRCGQAKEPSDTKLCRLKLRLEKTLIPPTVMCHAHSCQHFVSGIASLVFLRARKLSWSPALRFCPEPILALADTVQSSAGKQIPRREAFNEVPLTLLRTVAIWSLTTHGGEEQKLLRVREGWGLHQHQLLPE